MKLSPVVLCDGSGGALRHPSPHGNVQKLGQRNKDLDMRLLGTPVQTEPSLEGRAGEHVSVGMN